jgi:hypothetical protein
VVSGGTATIPKYYSAAGQRFVMRTGNTLYYLPSEYLGSSTIALSCTCTVSTLPVQLFASFSARFIQTDSVQNNTNGTDPYAYEGENLETKTDPTGRYYSIRW